ncbi:MAG TPA: AAA family ATPase, partial [Acidimicrobiales bacterium]
MLSPATSVLATDSGHLRQTGGVETWPLVGRTEELAYLAQVIADPTSVGMVVAGGAGVGKTRLVREAGSAAEENGCHVEVVTATESARPLPFGAFSRQLPSDMGSVDRIDLLAVIGRHLASRAEGRPMVLVVDDVHLLDDLSAALVHHVATAELATVLLTLRSGEVSPDATTALHRNGVVTRMELQPVSRSEFNALVEAALGGPAELATLEQMWNLTEGNVLFARELIGDVLASGSLHVAHGLWRWDGGLGSATRLRETVSGRLGALDDGARSVLDLLAVGEPLSSSVLARWSALGDPVSLIELERRSLITVEAGGERPGDLEVRLAHPLMGETLRTSMLGSRVREINHFLAEEEAAKSVKRRNALMLALRQEAAGEPLDPEVALEAARMANARSDYVLAERLARTAGAGAELELGQALNGQYRFGEAETVLMGLVDQVKTDTERQQLADALALAVGYGDGRLRGAIEVFATIEKGIEDPVIRAMVQAQRAAMLVVEARFAEAIELGTEALRSVDDDGVRMRALAPVGISLVMFGRTAEALALTEDSSAIAESVRERLPRAPGWALSARVSALSFAGRTTEAIALIGRSSSPSTPAALGYLGILALVQGRPRTAVRLLNDAALRLRSSSTNLEPSWLRSRVAEAHALLGDLEAARLAAEESVALRRSEAQTFRPDELRALAWVDAQSAQVTSALEQLWQAADLAASRGQVMIEVVTLGDLLRMGERSAAERCLTVVDGSGGVDGAWAAAIAQHARAILSGLPDDLAVAAGQFADMGHHLVAAEIWATVSSQRQRDGLVARAA